MEGSNQPQPRSAAVPQRSAIPPPDVMNLNEYFGILDANITVTPYGAAFVSPRTGTLYIFDSALQYFHNGAGDRYFGPYGAWRHESNETQDYPTYNRVEIFLDPPPDGVFLTNSLMDFGAFRGRHEYPADSVQEARRAGWTGPGPQGQWLAPSTRRSSVSQQTAPATIMQQPRPQAPMGQTSFQMPRVPSTTALTMSSLSATTSLHRFPHQQQGSTQTDLLRFAAPQQQIVDVPFPSTASHAHHMFGIEEGVVIRMSPEIQQGIRRMQTGGMPTVEVAALYSAVMQMLQQQLMQAGNSFHTGRCSCLHKSTFSDTDGTTASSRCAFHDVPTSSTVFPVWIRNFLR